MIWAMEKLVRIHDQLDEQLHAGYYFYILTGPGKFISNNQFVWAVAFMFAGLNWPLVLDYFNHEAVRERRAVANAAVQGEDRSKSLAVLFIATSYYLGYLMTTMPGIYLNLVRPWYEPLAETEQRNLLILQAGHIVCSADHDYNTMMRQEITEFTLKATLSASCLFLGLFKLIQGRTYAPEIWYYTKTINALLMGSVGGALIMIQYPVSLMIGTIQFVMLFIYPIVPLTQTLDFSWKSYISSATVSIAWLTFSLSVVVFIIFGTTVDQENYDIYRISGQVLEMLKQAILDYECVGSRVWLILLSTILPNILMTFKILTN